MNRLIKTIKKNEYMIITWFKYNLESSYIDTKLGIFWLILQPIFHTLIYTLFFGLILNRSPRGNVPFVLFFLVGTTTWSFINNNWMRAPNIITGKLNVLDEVSMDSDAIILIELLESVFEFTINFIVVIILSTLYGYYPTSAYLFLPIIFGLLLILTTGGMFFLAGLGVFLRDTQKIMGVVLRLLFFTSAVIITPDMVPETYGDLLFINPLVHFIEGVRSVVLYAESPTVLSLTYMASFSLLIFIIGYRFFIKRQGIFVDYR